MALSRGFPRVGLPTTLPCDVRTFLEGRASATAWPAKGQPTARGELLDGQPRAAATGVVADLRPAADGVEVDCGLAVAVVAQRVPEKGDEMGHVVLVSWG